MPQWCHKSLSFLFRGLCGQSTCSSLRFNISLEKEPQRCVDACSKTITQKSHLGATRFPVCLLTTLPILDFDISFSLLEDKNVSPAALVQNHHCTSVPVHSPQYAGSCPLAQHFFKILPNARWPCVWGLLIHCTCNWARHCILRLLLWLTVWLSLHPNLF